MKSSLEIAQEHELRPIAEIAAVAGLAPDEIEFYGDAKAKIKLSALGARADTPRREAHLRRRDHADEGR